MSCKAAYDTRYAYGADALGAEGTLDNNFRLRKRRVCATYGNRAAKWTATKSSETLYFNTMWTWHTDTGLREGQYSKHIYLGETRVLTKQTSKLEASYGQSDEWHHQYYYHPDHLGSAQLITDYEGNEYQRIEYTPYGELWVEKKSEHEEGLRYLPYKFTAKEQDEETGLYYYGARYLDAKYSRWLSADPAVGEYIPQAPVNDEAKKHNEQLPGMGGVFNIVNFQLYHYAGNNPVKYTDPDGRIQRTADGNITFYPLSNRTDEIGNSGQKISVQWGYIKANDDSHITVRINFSKIRQENFNCHGFTFTNGSAWVEPNQVASLLKGDGYVQTEAPEVGGIFVQYAPNGEAFHSGKIIAVDKENNTITVEEAMGVATFRHKDG